MFAPETCFHLNADLSPNPKFVPAWSGKQRRVVLLDADR
jgi:hypothetical protein